MIGVRSLMVPYYFRGTVGRRKNGPRKTRGLSPLGSPNVRKFVDLSQIITMIYDSPIISYGFYHRVFPCCFFIISYYSL